MPDRLGSVTTSPPNAELQDHEDGFGDKSRARVDGSGISVFKRGHGWDVVADGEPPMGLRWLLVAMDDTIWARTEDELIRIVGEERTLFEWNEVGPPAGCIAGSPDGPALECATTRMVESPDGGAWLGFASSAGAPLAGGLRRYDGESWAKVPGPLDGEPFAVTQLTRYQGGDVWALIVPEDAEDPGQGAYGRAELARWGGDTWARYALPTGLQEVDASQPRELVAGPDRSVWLLRPLASFDGETWRTYDTPARASSKRPRAEDLSIAPDGSAWMVVRNATGPGRTRPDGIYVLDPERAKPTQEIVATAP